MATRKIAAATGPRRRAWDKESPVAPYIAKLAAIKKRVETERNALQVIRDEVAMLVSSADSAIDDLKKAIDALTKYV